MVLAHETSRADRSPCLAAREACCAAADTARHLVEDDRSDDDPVISTERFAASIGVAEESPDELRRAAATAAFELALCSCGQDSPRGSYPARAASLRFTRIAGHRSLPVHSCIKMSSNGQTLLTLDVRTNSHPSRVFCTALKGDTGAWRRATSR